MNADFAKVKKLFFDRAAVTSAADRATVRALAKFGAFVRRRAKSSIRARKRVSEPGSPPSSHKGTLRDSILFAYDPGRRSVVIGPTTFRGSGEGARALEEGGPVTVDARSGVRHLHIRPRPYMRPAFVAELPRVPEQFRGGMTR